MSQGLVTASYIVAAVLFILSLAGLSKQETAKHGNLFGIAGMAIALLATVFNPETSGVHWIVLAMVIGGAIGVRLALKVEMTEMPELVAVLHSFVGMAAVLIAIAAVNNPLAFGIVKAAGDAIPMGNKLELFIGTFVGAMVLGLFVLPLLALLPLLFAMTGFVGTVAYAKFVLRGDVIE